MDCNIGEQTPEIAGLLAWFGYLDLGLGFYAAQQRKWRGNCRGEISAFFDPFSLNRLTTVAPNICASLRLSPKASFTGNTGSRKIDPSPHSNHGHCLTYTCQPSIEASHAERTDVDAIIGFECLSAML